MQTLCQKIREGHRNSKHVALATLAIHQGGFPAGAREELPEGSSRFHSNGGRSLEVHGDGGPREVVVPGRGRRP